MSKAQQRSVFTASLTPLDLNLNIDYNGLCRHVQWLLKRDASGVVLMGTTGEANSFSISERKLALEAVLYEGIDPDQLIVGTGCCALTDTLDLTRHALRIGISRILVLPPFYYKNVSDDGLYAYYDRLLQQLDSSKVRIYLYHFPKMSATPITPALVERMMIAYPQIIAGFKDSSGDWENILAMIQEFPDLQVFAGSEQFLLNTLRAGGAGCISATTNLTSQLAAELLTNWDSPQADLLQDLLYRIRKTVERWPMVPALKVLMRNLTGWDGWINLRPPLTPLSCSEARRCVDLYNSVSNQALLEMG